MPHTTNFIQLNMHRAFEASVELSHRLQNKPAICMITEPCTTLNKICQIPPGMTCIPSITLPERPRSAIFLPCNTPHVYLEQLSNRDCAAILLDTKCCKVLLVSIYLDYDLPVIQDWMEEVVQYATDKKLPLLMSLDSNAHTELYGPETNERGVVFEEFISNNNLLVENRGNKATYHAFRHGQPVSSHIDFTLTQGFVPLLGWTVHDDEYNGSDHYTITWELQTEMEPLPMIRPWLKAKWDVFSDQISNYDFHLPTNFTTYKLDKLLDRWYQVVNTALDTACPKRQARPTPVELDWFGDDHKYMRARTKRKYQAYKRSSIAAKRKSFVRSKRAYRRACQRGKRQSWRIFVEQTPNQTNMAKLFKLAQRRDRRTINTLKRPDNTLTNPGSETILELTRAHFPAAQPGSPPTSYDSSHKVDTETLHEKYDWITSDLVRRSMRLFKPNKAAGPDEIKPLVFKYLPDNAIDTLVVIYKACIALSHTPRRWRETKVIFLPKPGKEVYDIPKSYRPISLSNFLLKVLERLVVWKIDGDMLQHPIHPKQHGFTKGKSTESAISNTADYIEQQLYQKQHCLGVFLDISSAFDSISIDHIKQTLLDHNGDQEVVSWYHSYLGRRHLEVELHGDKVQLTTATGFPQGGVCSARFWLVAFDEAIRIINSEGISGNGYADDCAALLGGTNIQNMVDKMQSMLERLVTWGLSCGLHFNPQKTVVVLFTRATREFRRLVRMNGELIPYSDSVVYLGVTLDKELKWQTHIDNKILKAKRLLMKMASITQSYWGPQPKLMRWMYTGIVRPVVSYAAMVWAHQIEDDTVEDKLRTLNRRAINTMVKIPRSTPTRGLEIILDILPLHLHIKKEGFAAYSRIKKLNPLQWEGIFTNLENSVSHLRYWEYFANDMNVQDFHVETDDCHVMRPPAKYLLDSSSFDDMENCQSQAEYNVYTDGSKIDSRVGAGVFVTRRGEVVVQDKFRLPDHATVYQAELSAIREAAALLRTMQGLGSVKFFVDSQAALRTLQSDFITSKLALQTIYSLNDIPASSIVLVWTEAHIGNYGNEKADALAKAGTMLPNPLAIPVPASNIKKSIKDLITSRWCREWESHDEARQTKIYHPTLVPQISKQLLQWPRLKLGRYIRAVTGHNNLLYHLHHINPTISPICRFCLQANEEFHHLASDCPPFWWDRHHISAQDPEHATQWTIQQISDFTFLPAINEAFIKPLYDISTPRPTPLTTPIETSQDPDDPSPIDSDQRSESDISVMDASSEPTSDSDSFIDIDDP